MKRNILHVAQLAVIFSLFFVDLSFADAPWYIIPLKVRTHTITREIYGMFYNEVIKGRDELGQPQEFRFNVIREEFDSITVKNKKDIIIANKDGKTTRILDVNYFLTQKGLKYFTKYTLDKDGHTIWIEKNDYGYLTLREIEGIKRNGLTKSHTVVTGKPEDLMLGKGLYRIQFEIPNGCTGEFQSDSPHITEKELKQILRLLIGVPEGLNDEYPLRSIYDFSKSIRDRKEYCTFAKKKIREVEETISKLKDHDIIPEMRGHKNSIVKNYQERLRYMKIMYRWLENNDLEKFSRDVKNFYSDTTILSILESIKPSDNWLKTFKMMNFQLYKHLNQVKFPYADVQFDQKLLLEKNRLRIVYDPRCQD
jgi:hypothetical protein